MSSGKIIENFQIKVNNYLGHNPIEVNLSLDPLVYNLREINIDLENILYKIYEIHLILKTNSQLSNNQRLHYCKVERTLMIEYLKKLVKKV